MPLGTPTTIYTTGDGVQPHSLAVDCSGDLWFGTSSHAGGAGDVYRVSGGSHSVVLALSDAEYVAYNEQDGLMCVGDRGWSPDRLYFIDEGGADYRVNGPSGSSFFKPMVRPSTGHAYMVGFTDTVWEYRNGVLVGTHVSTLTGSVLSGGSWHEDVLYFFDYADNGRVVSFDPTTDTWSIVFNDWWTTVDPSNNFDDVAVLDGRIYMADRNVGGSIYSVGVDGSSPTAEYTPPSGFVFSLQNIGGVLHGTNPVDGTILRWGASTPIPSCPSCADGDLLIPRALEVFDVGFRPTSIATDGTSLFIGSTNNLQGEVYRIDTVSNPTSISVLSALDDAERIAYHDGFIYAVEYDGSSNQGVHRIDVSTGATTLFVDGSAFTFNLYNIAVNPTNGHIFVVDDAASNVYEFDPSGTLVTTNTADGFVPWNLRWSSERSVFYVLDLGGVNGRLLTLDPSTGTFEVIYETGADHGIGDDLAIVDGRVYVTDTWFDGLWSCDLDGADFRKHLGEGQDVAISTLSFASGMIEINGSLYLSDANHNRIVRFRLCGGTCTQLAAIAAWDAASGNHPAIQLFDVTDPENPVARATINKDDLLDWSYAFHAYDESGSIQYGRTVWHGDYLFCFEHSSWGDIVTVDCSDPDNPVIVGAIAPYEDSTPGPPLYPNGTEYPGGTLTGKVFTTWAAVHDGHLICVGTSGLESQGGTGAISPGRCTVVRFDISDPANLTMVDYVNFDAATDWSAFTGAIINGRLFTGSRFDLTTTLFVFDLATMTKVGQVDVGVRTAGLNPLGTELFVDTGTTIAVIDASTATPSLDRTLTVPDANTVGGLVTSNQGLFAYYRNTAGTINGYLEIDITDGSIGAVVPGTHDLTDGFSQGGEYPVPDGADFFGIAWFDDATSAEGLYLVHTDTLTAGPFVPVATTMHTNSFVNHLSFQPVCPVPEECWNWVDLGELPDGGGEIGVVATIGWNHLGNMPVDGGSSPTFGVVTANAVTVGEASAHRLVLYADDGTVNVHAARLDDLSYHAWAYSLAPGHFIRGMALDDANGLLWLIVENTTDGWSEVYRCDLSTNAAWIHWWWTDSSWNGHAAFNPTNGLIYVADANTSTLWEVDMTPDAESRTAVANPTGMGNGIAVTSDGGVWFDSGTEVHRYDPATGITATVTASIGGEDPLTFDDNSVFYLSSGGSVTRVTFDGSTLTTEIVPEADTSDTDIWNVAGGWRGAYQTYMFDLGSAPGFWQYDTSRKVFYTDDGDVYIRSAEYPSLASLNDKIDGSNNYTYLLPYTGTVQRLVQGITLGPAGELYVLVERRAFGDNGAELWEFDTSNPDDPGTIVFEDPEESGSHTGVMKGHIAYNSTDDRIYIAESYDYWDSVELDYFGSLCSIDRSTWTRTNHLKFYNTDGRVVRGNIAVTPDGVVWFDTDTAGDVEWLHAYDPATTNTAHVEIAFDQEPFALVDNSVITLNLSGLASRHTFTGSAVSSVAYSIADAAGTNLWDFSGGWASTHANGGPGEAWVFDWDSHLWTYNTDCPAGCVGCWYVGMVGIIAL